MPTAYASPQNANPATESAASPTSASSRTSLRSQSYSEGAAALSPRSRGPALAEAGQGVAETTASAGTIDGVVALLDQGLLAEAKGSLEGIVEAARNDLSSDATRDRLKQATSALAVVNSLVAAKAAVEAGAGGDATRHRQAAAATFSRTIGLDEALMTALGKQVGVSGAQKAPLTNTSAGPAVQGYDPAIGRALANRSAAISGGNPIARGRCYARVADAVDAVIGGFLWGGHAYMAASQLAAKKNLFTEVSASNLSGLPAGAIVVWAKGSSESGHISIALGDGRESSDFVGRQMTRHYGGGAARVFLPKGRMGR